MNTCLEIQIRIIFSTSFIKFKSRQNHNHSIQYTKKKKKYVLQTNLLIHTTISSTTHTLSTHQCHPPPHRKANLPKQLVQSFVQLGVSEPENSENGCQTIAKLTNRTIRRTNHVKIGHSEFTIDTNYRCGAFSAIFQRSNVPSEDAFRIRATYNIFANT